MHRRNAQIRQNPVGAADALQDEIEIPEVLFRELDSIRETRETLAGEIERLGVAVDAEQADLRPSLEKRLRMSAGAERRIHEETASLGLEHLSDLLQEDRYVLARPFVVRFTTPSFTISKFEIRNSNWVFPS